MSSISINLFADTERPAKIRKSWRQEEQAKRGRAGRQVRRGNTFLHIDDKRSMKGKRQRQRGGNARTSRATTTKTKGTKTFTTLPFTKASSEPPPQPPQHVRVAPSGTVLEPSGLFGSGEVLSVGDNVYDVSLHLTDDAKNHRKFYKLQLVNLTDKGEVHLVTQWGRAGTTGQTQVKGPWPQAEAISAFGKQFKAKTGVDFADRHGSSGVDGKYNMFDIQQRLGEDADAYAARRKYSTVAFCLDRSGSMGARVGPNDTRFSVVSSHLLELLEAASPSLQFSVILFDNVVQCWRGGALVENTCGNRDSLRHYLATHGPRGGTNLLAGIEALLSVEGVQERFLLADGDAWSGREKIVKLAKADPINCVGVGLSVGRGGHTLLTDIASAGGGATTFLAEEHMRKY